MNAAEATLKSGKALVELANYGRKAAGIPGDPPSCWLQPLAFNVVVELDPVEEITKGGIILIKDETERERHAAQVGTLVAKSPHAFSYANWPDGTSPPEVGASVMVSRYTGLLKERDGKDYRIVEDKHVIGVIGEE